MQAGANSEQSEFAVGFVGSSYFDGSAPVNALSRNEVHWIAPRGATSLDALPRLPLPGLDHVFNPIDALMVYPGPIDVQRLKDAIEMTLRAYPHAAGRLQKDVKGKWHLKLTKSPIPLIISSSASVTTEDSMYSEPVPNDLVDPLPWTFFPLDDKQMSEQPLIKFKLVELVMTGETSLAVHASHVLGDASSLFMLLKTVSDYYEHPERKPSIPFPTYEKYLSTPLPPPLPTSNIYQDVATCIPNLFSSFTRAGHDRFLEETQRTTERTDFRVYGRQMRLLQQIVSAEAGEKVSQGDALVALFWKAINEVYPDEERCDKLMNIVQYRARITDDGYSVFDFPSNSSMGNVRLPLVSSPVPQSQLSSLGALALCVRRLITQTCDPQLITPCIALAEDFSLNIARRGEVASFAPQKGCIGASLMHKGGFHEVHFGYRGEVKFWPLNEPVERYVRVVPANREWAGLKGVQSSSEEEGVVVVSLRVKTDVKERFVNIINGELRRLDASATVKGSHPRDYIQQML